MIIDFKVYIKVILKKMNKIRIRSNEELKIQNIGLIELSKILKTENVLHFITGGTLLGAIREKNFIKWDWDVEITILTDQIFINRKNLNKAFLRSGFKISKFIDKYDSLKWELIKYDCTYELVGFYEEGEWMYRLGKGMKVPSYLFKKQSNLFFLGNNYQTVSDPIKYLEFCYGDWQTPKRTSDKRKYLNFSHVPKLKLYNIFFQKLKNFFNRGK